MPKAPKTQLKQPVQQRSQATVKVILEAAVQVFEKHGHAAGTTARIAERAGVSVGSLYQYFPNKDAILAALADQHLQEVDAVALRVMRATLGRELSLAQAVDVLIEGFLALHEHNPVLHRLLYEEGLLPVEVRQRVQRREEGYRSALAQVLATHPEVREGDAQLQAWFVIRMLEHFTHMLVIDPPARAIRRAGAAELKDLILRYLRP